MAGFGGIPGRNKFKKNCFKCGFMVPANEGYLKKHGDKYVVKCLKECKPDFDEKAFLSKKPALKPINLAADDDLLGVLKSELAKREKEGQSVSMLPKIIAHIEGLNVKLVILEKQIEKNAKFSADYSKKFK